MKTSNLTDTLFEAYYEEYLHLFPLDATSSGDQRFNHMLPNNISQQFENELKAFYLKYQEKANTIDSTQLNIEQSISLKLLKRNIELGLRRLEFQEEFTPINQFWSLTLVFQQLGSGSSIQPFQTEKDYYDFLQRIDSFEVWSDSAIENMRLGIKTGIVNPKAIMLKVLPQLQSVMVNDYKESVFYNPIKKTPENFSESVRDTLKILYKQAIVEKIIPTYSKLTQFIKNEYIPMCRNSSGLYGTPKAKEYYQFLICFYTGTNLSPDSIYNLGLTEVARIKNEMEQVKNQVRFQGSLSDFLKFTTIDNRFKPFHTANEVIETYRTILKRIEPRVNELFKVQPHTKFEIRRTESFREASASAEYSPGSADGKRPGIFYVPVPNPSNYNLIDMEALFLHEAIPGHHFQISLAQEMDQIPRFRKYGWDGAYGEGWALYCEGLGKDLGLYTDPYQYYGRLSNEMHRAIRLVVDVGLHSKGWTREEVIKYMLDNESISEEDAIAETERYMAIPGQALSYKIGELTILSCRKKAENLLGEHFDIAEFHNQVLGSGCIPVDILEQKIDDWIKSQLNSKTTEL